jgi:hypothetical protein
MRRLILLSLLALLARPLVTHACTPAVSVEPPRPTTSDDIELALRGTCGDAGVPYSPRVRVTADKIEATLSRYLGGILVRTEWGERIRIGRLPAGSYELTVRILGVPPDISFDPLVIPLMVEDAPFDIAPSFGEAGTQVLIEGVPRFNCDRLDCITVLFGDVPATVGKISV